MSLLTKLVQRRLPTVGPSRVTIRTDRDRAAVRAELGQGLERLAALDGERDVEVVELQLLLQVIAQPSYDGFRAGWEKAWCNQNGRWTTRSWLEELPDGHVGVLLLPLRAGRVGVAVGRYPRAAADPLFTSGTGGEGAGHLDACLSVLTSWVCRPGAGVTARLAPPVIEVIQRGRVASRTVEDFGQSWPLPVADGV
jgi:hypothetical protein